MDNFHIITGGPGAGKTALIAELARRGYAVSGESGRAILQLQQTIDGPAQHHRNAALYAELMLSWDMRAWNEMRNAHGPVFFDRGIPELTGYHALFGRPTPLHFDLAARRCRYNPDVFFAPPWPEIYAHDAERTQSLGEAIRSAELIPPSYRDFGYRIVELPKAPVAARADFVLAHLSRGGLKV